MGITTEIVTWGALDCCCNNKDCLKVESISWSCWFTANVGITLNLQQTASQVSYFNQNGELTVIFVFSDGTTYEYKRSITNPSIVQYKNYYEMANPVLHSEIELEAFTVRIDKEGICEVDALWQFNSDSLPLVSPDSPALPKWGNVDVRYEKNDGGAESWSPIG